MYPVTEGFHQVMQANKRRVLAKATIDYTDPFLDQSVTIEPNEAARISYPFQTADGILKPAAKFASLDGSWKLNADYKLAPDPSEARIVQMGWWGGQLSDENYLFVVPYPLLTVEFFNRPIDSLRVVGDNKRGEYPVNFEIVLYDKTDTVLYTETVTGNDGVVWSKPLIEPVPDVVKMTLEISRWSHEGRQVKILEFFTSLRELYETDDIVSIRLIEERELSHGSLPVGNISSNEIELRLYNHDRKFDVGNTSSPLYELLRANRKIALFLGTEIGEDQMEYVPLGVFWSGNWKVPEDGLYAHTLGRDRLELLRQSTYNISQVVEDETLYDLAEAVLVSANLMPDEYWIDPELEQFVVPYAYFEPQTHREALRKIAEACVGQVYCDREGTIRVEGPSYFIQGTPLPYDIGPDDYFTKDNPAKWEEIANYIEVETLPLVRDTSGEVYRSNDLIEADEEIVITVQYNHVPCMDAAANLVDVTGSVIITDAKYYAGGAEVTVSCVNKSSFRLKIDATPLKVQNKEMIVAQDKNSVKENGLIRFTFPGNPLVQTQQIARRIAETILFIYKDPRRGIEMDWRGNPAIELGDVITAPDYQAGGEDVKGYFIVTRQEIEYTGTLRAKLAGRRIVAPEEE